VFIFARRYEKKMRSSKLEIQKKKKYFMKGFEKI